MILTQSQINSNELKAAMQWASHSVALSHAVTKRGPKFTDVSDIRVLFSVDPLADLSPYNYCERSSVMLIDPNGMNRIRNNQDIADENLQYYIKSQSIKNVVIAISN